MKERQRVGLKKCMDYVMGKTN